MTSLCFVFQLTDGVAASFYIHFQSEELGVVSLGAANGHSLRCYSMSLCLLMHLILYLVSQATTHQFFFPEPLLEQGTAHLEYERVVGTVLVVMTEDV